MGVSLGCSASRRFSVSVGGWPISDHLARLKKISKPLGFLSICKEKKAPQAVPPAKGGL